jgi:hypothetical protein
MGQSVQHQSTKYHLAKYRPVSPPLLKKKLLNNGKGCYSEVFKNIPDYIILYIVNYLNYLDRRALEQVCRRSFVIIRLRRPKFSYPFVFWSHTKIKDSRKQGSYEFCMVLHDLRATYKGNTDMGPVHYFDVIMNQCTSRFHEEDSPVWNVMRLEGETSIREITRFWATYLQKCLSLVCLKLDNISNIDLNFTNHPNLEIFIMELKSADGRGATIDLPPSMKTIILYATEENYRKHYTQNSRPYVDHLYLNAPECMDLELW